MFSLGKKVDVEYVFKFGLIDMVVFVNCLF